MNPDITKVYKSGQSRKKWSEQKGRAKTSGNDGGGMDRGKKSHLPSIIAFFQ